jgi:hypothetical protein
MRRPVAFRRSWPWRWPRSGAAATGLRLRLPHRPGRRPRRRRRRSSASWNVAAAVPKDAGRPLASSGARSCAPRRRPGHRDAQAQTEFGSARVLGVTAARAWLRVVATEQRDGRPAWIPAAAARLGATDLSIHVDRSARRLVLRRGSRTARAPPVAVGRPGTETPLGALRGDRQALPAPRRRAIRLLRDRPLRAPAQAPSRLAGRRPPRDPRDARRVHRRRAASLGCLRARARDVRRLMRRLALGTPVFIARDRADD